MDTTRRPTRCQQIIDLIDACVAEYHAQPVPLPAIDERRSDR